MLKITVRLLPHESNVFSSTKLQTFDFSIIRKNVTEILKNNRTDIEPCVKYHDALHPSYPATITKPNFKSLFTVVQAIIR